MSYKIFKVKCFIIAVVGILICAPFVYAEDAEKWMPDPNLRQAVRETLTPTAGTPLTKEKMQQLHLLKASHKGILDLTGLESATNLRVLHIDRNPIIDLRPLANLTQLQQLHFWHSPPRPTNLDLGPLTHLINLEVLSLEGNGISDISPLSN